MSSYTSGIYYIAEEIRDRIRAQANRELQTLNEIRREATQLESEHDAWVAQQKQREDSRQRAEQAGDKAAHEAAIYADGKQKALRQEAEMLLISAGERIEKLEGDSPEKQSMLEMIGCLQENMELFDVTEQSIVNIRQFVRETVPQTVKRLFDRQEQERLEKLAEQGAKVKPVVTDQSRDFVSLLTDRPEVGTTADPWETFVARTKVLAARQEAYGGFGAADLLDEILAATPQQRGLLMLRYGQELDVWEQEAEEFARKNRELEQCYEEYLTLRKMCAGLAVAERKPLQRTASLVRLKQECTLLMDAYVEQQNHRYLESSFRKVFEAHGLQFEAMQVEAEHVSIDFSMDHESVVRVYRSESGAFEMQFVSHAGSDSTDSRRRAVEKANGFCHVMPEICADLAELGIMFEQRVLQEPTEAAIVFEPEQRRAPMQQKNNKTMQMK